jgi:predicted flap endonuclease-1-like 5' DNA nuclease
MYGHFNPLELADAWWQHILMLVVSAILGYIIGYRSRRSEIEGLEADLAALEVDVEDCLKSKKIVAPMPDPVPEVRIPEPVATPPLAVFAPPLAMVAPVKPDDLKIVEGIGPKIEELLHNEGVLTYAQLAETAPERIKEILVAAGSRFQMHDPTTWPDQSAMARDGKFDELKQWQDELNKGREA